MTRGEIRRYVYNQLGDRGGFWAEVVVNDFIQLAADRHAREGLSVERSRKTNSLPGVQEYDFPDNYGELIAVRYNDEGLGYEGNQLTLADKSALLDSGYDSNFLGYPQYYYVFDDGFGLFPIPNKPPIFQHTFEGRCPFFISPQNLDSDTFYRNRINLDIEFDDDDTADEDCNVYVSHIGMYLRRQGAPYPGELTLAMSQLDDGGDVMFRVDSAPIYVEDISTRPQWYTFDFSDSPLELTPDVKFYDMWLYTNLKYSQTLMEAPDGMGILVGGEPVRSNGETIDTAFFQLHRLRNDIEIDYWANKTKRLTTDDESPEPHERHHEALIELTLGQAWAVANRNLRLAQWHEGKGVDQINQSRTRQLKRAHGKRIRTERITLANVPYSTYNQASDTFTISIG